MIRRLRRAQEGIHFLDILLDETICEGKILVPEELVRDAGGINEKLQAKQKYELLLRIAQQSPIVLEEISGKESSDGYVILGADEADCSAEQGCVTDCYVIGKYSGELKAAGCFDMAIMGVLEQAQKLGCEERMVPYLEHMVAHGKEYYALDEETEPILIYKGDDVCHNVLTVFAEQFGAALEHAGQHVIYYDLNDEDVAGILKFMGRHFKAVIGVQSYLFSVKMADEVHYVHEYIYGPNITLYLTIRYGCRSIYSITIRIFMFLRWIRIMQILQKDISEKRQSCFLLLEWQQKNRTSRNVNTDSRLWARWETIFLRYCGFTGWSVRSVFWQTVSF